MSECSMKIEELMKDGIQRLRKIWPDEELVIFINPELGQKSGEFLGCKVIAHRAMEPGKIIVMRKKDIYPFENYEKLQEGK